MIADWLWNLKSELCNLKFEIVLTAPRLLAASLPIGIRARRHLREAPDERRLVHEEMERIKKGGAEAPPMETARKTSG